MTDISKYQPWTPPMGVLLRDGTASELLTALDVSTLDALLQEFRAAVFRRAGKEDPRADVSDHPVFGRSVVAGGNINENKQALDKDDYPF